MKNPKVRTPTLRASQVFGVGPAPSARASAEHRVFRTQVAVGDVIHFDPTGEQLRVMRIEGEHITFEKLP